MTEGTRGDQIECEREQCLRMQNPHSVLLRLTNKLSHLSRSNKNQKYSKSRNEIPWKIISWRKGNFIYLFIIIFVEASIQHRRIINVKV